MREGLQSLLRSCLLTLLYPIAGFCIARGLRIQDIHEMSKRAFVASAKRRLERDGHDVSISKLSVMTGIQRAEISKLLNTKQEAPAKNLIVRIIGQWASDPRFSQEGKPISLSITGSESEFASLVTAVSTDLNPHTVRFELERLRLISIDEGRANLTAPVYSTEGDIEETLRRGAGDVRDLLNAIEENAFAINGTPHLQARTEYDNVPNEELPGIREWLLEAGGRWHEEVRQYLSKFDRDINPSIKGTGRSRVVVGTFSCIGDVEEEEGTTL